MEKNEGSSGAAYMQNRELSWLRFNERVLEEAQDPEVPLFERLKFFSIFSNNLDEFFMIRVGSLYDLSAEKGSEVTDNKTGMTAREQIKAVYEVVRPLYLQRDRTYSELRKLMYQEGIHHLAFSELTDTELEYIREYFSRYIQPVLSPQIVDNHHPFPFVPNKKLFVALQLESRGKDCLGLIPVPAEVPELIFLPGEEIRFVPSVKVIYEYAKQVFDLYNVLDKVIFCVTRNADISVEDQDIDMTEDFRSVMKKLLKKRRSLEIVRLELNKKIRGWMKETLCSKLHISEDAILISRAPILMNFESQITYILDEKRKKGYYYKPFRPQAPSELSPRESIIAQVMKQDVLLSYPYESMDPFLRMIKEASEDSSVISIKITIYRVAQRAKLVEYLCAAAENGKEVVVLIELRARFDEQNNIDWSEHLEEAGCRLIYGIGEYKVHSKVCLITRKFKGDYLYIAQIGTGNYNEKTTELYTDFSLITANQEIGRDASNFFKNMTISNLSGEYQHLLVAPNSMKDRIIELIEAETAKGEDGRIAFKVNSVTDYEIIRKLRDASCAGVRIDMIVRGICCILPGIPGETEHIRVTSIVGRFLEHSRIYRFGTGTEQKLYISSADFMTRNMDRRVEVACPILAGAIRDRLNTAFDSMLYDTEKARVMQQDGSYERKPGNLNRINIQELFIEEANRKARLAAPERPLKAFFRDLRQRASLYLFQ
jgi:polyphosphate kinase